MLFRSVGAPNGPGLASGLSPGGDKFCKFRWNFRGGPGPAVETAGVIGGAGFCGGRGVEALWPQRESAARLSEAAGGLTREEREGRFQGFL